MDFLDKVTVIKGIGEKTNILLNKLGIINVKDILEYYPSNYDEFKRPIEINTVREGEIVAVRGTIIGTPKLKRVRNLQIINAVFKDKSGEILLTWYNMVFLTKTLRQAYTYIIRGKVVKKNGILLMEQAKVYEQDEYYKMLNIFSPIYPLTKGLTSNSLAKYINIALKEVEDYNEYLSTNTRSKYNLINRKKAIKDIHFPSNREDLIKARERLVFDEFFLYIIGIRGLKEERDKLSSLYRIKDFDNADNLIKKLPYDLTKSQKVVWNEIKKDLSSGKVMNRLIQGDVGSGKTIIAALSMVSMYISGYQSAIMAPTEILAKQHYETLTNLYKEFNISISLLVGSMTSKQKKEVYKKLLNKEVDIIVGTHALIQDKIEYNNLGLIIIDEQHRFGVKQRKLLSNKGNNPHVLLMSATPIPRTLAIILYGDFNLSVIDELPLERLPVKNAVVNSNYRQAAYKLIREQISEGRQAYIICPMVEESDTLEVENVIGYYEDLINHMPDISIKYLHGKMKADEKNTIMEEFAKGEIKVLVSTTVVEVGVNVPNATVMMVENAERFGLAQLHQLRGRVGRGKYQSYCMFFCGNESKVAKERLEILKNSNDGFYIASEDLKLRGPGDLFGIIQSGQLEFKIADIYNDSNILKKANDLVDNLNVEEKEKIINNDYLINLEVSL